MNIHESVSRFGKLHLTSFVLLATWAAVAVAQSERRPLTLEWIFVTEGRAVASVPQTAWLDDGSLIILDNRRPARERTFEKVSPTTGQRAAMVDPARALAELKSIAAVESDVLPWPIAFDGAGRRALYILKGNVFTRGSGWVVVNKGKAYLI